MNIYIAIACLLASVNADGPLGVGGLGGLVYAPGHASSDYYSFPRYAFEYSVKDPHTGDNKAQWEKREGDVVKGAYSLVEPDGSLRIVEYFADDKSGFNAVVKRIGPNLHPTTVHAAPIYKAPIPVLGHGPVVAPISIGPVAKLGHLADAPLISGPVHGAVSTQSLIKSSVPVIKPVIPVAPIHLPAAPIHHEPLPILREPYVHHDLPILPPVPIHNEPILPPPIIKTIPIISGPIYRAGPIYSKPLGPPPYYKAPLPIYKEPLPLLKAPLELGPVEHSEGINYGPIGPWGDFNKGLVPLNPYGPLHGIPKIPIGHGYDVIEKGPLLPAWKGPLDYSLIGYKH